MSESLFEPVNTLAPPLPWQLAQWAQIERARANDSLAHAYLLSGSEGLGKSLFAHGLAEVMLCKSPIAGPEHSQGGTHAGIKVACGACANCLKGGVGHHPDLLSIEPEEGSRNIKIEQIRRLSEFVIRSSHSGGDKIAVIEQAHLLHGNAANALLKTLEEPNRNTYLLLVSDHPGRLVATIRSRCQKLSFPTPDVEIARPWLQELLGGANADSLLAAADGRPLTALNLAEGDTLQAREEFIQSICDLKRGRKSLQQTLGLAASIGEAEVLQHFSTFLTKLTKYSLADAESAGVADDEVESLRALLVPAENASIAKPAAVALAHFYAELESARKQLASNANPNPQLIMESVLWRWSKLRLS